MTTSKKKTNNGDRFMPSINKFHANRYPIMRQIGHQFKAENKHDNVETSIQDLIYKTKSKMEFSDMVKTKLQNSLDDSRFLMNRTADEDIDRELNVFTSRRAILSAQQYMECPYCMEKILRCSQNEHARVCEGYHSNKDVEKNQVSRVKINVRNIAVKPHVLRNLRLISVCFDAIHIAWDPPIFDGGEPLINFELSFFCESDRIHRKKARTKNIYMSCLRWCNKEPCAANSFVLDGLRASTQYSGIRVRCKNSIGWSDYSTALHSVKTGDPINPLPPQRFEITKVKSNMISFSWAPPFHTGGGDLLEYYLSYEEEVPAYNQEAGKLNQRINIQEKLVKIKGEKTCLDLTNLSGNAQFRNIRMKAMNHFGLTSEHITCKDVKTCEPSREEEIREEIARVKASTETHIDSDFFLPGVLQREERSAYLLKLEELLQTTKMRIDTRADSESLDWGTDLDSSPEVSGDHCDPFVMRQDNFKFRIEALKQELEDNREARQDNRRDRVLLIRKMREAQDNIFLLQAELNNLAICKEEYLSSSVLNGSVQKMKKHDLRKEIEKEIEDKMTLISMWKMKIVSGDKQSSNLDSLIEAKEEHLKERLAAHSAFKIRLETTSRMKSKTSKLTNDVLNYYMITWLQFTRYRKKRRLGLNHILTIKCHFVLGAAVNKWRAIIAPSSSIRPNNDQMFCSKGGRMLSEVQVKRLMACDEVKTSMVDFYGCINPSIPGKRNIAMTKIPKKIAFEVIRGDYHHNLNQYEDALRVYLGIMQTLSNKMTMPMDVYSNFYCILEEKVACTYMKANQWNNAILHLESLLCQANSSQYSEFISSAEIFLGECYLENRELELAKENYLNGLEKAKGMKDQYLLSASYHGLSRCFEAMDNPQKSDHYRSKLNALSLDVKDKISSAMGKAIDLQIQVTNTSLQEGRTIHFQNASFQYIKTKNKIHKIRRHIAEKTKESRECDEEMKRLHQLINRIDQEIELSLMNDETMQSSSLVHDNNQQIEKTDLIERLELRKKHSKDVLHKQLETQKEISFELKNMKDEESFLIQGLDLEQGELIQKVLKSRLIRCMAFNAMNKNGIDVFGTKSGGSQLIILTIGTDIYVHDMEKGSLRHVFVGGKTDDSKQEIGHTSIITCVHYHGDKIYSGAMDKTVRCWNINEECLEFVARGHTAMVTSIHSDGVVILSGSTDKNVILWDSCTGGMIYRTKGHSRGISSLHCGISWCISGDTDGEVFVWEMNEERNKLIRNRRLQGNHKITVVRCSKLEIICGDAGGFVSLWWVENGEVLQHCKVHDKSVTDLQFDATILVTCSMDAVIKVLDLTTFQVLQTIRGHQCPIQSICFDNTMILSLSNDGIMKQWLWQSQSGSNVDGEVFHTFTQGESLRSVCEQYAVTMKDLLKWNVNRDIKKITVGQKLLVIKGTIQENGDDIHHVQTGNKNGVFRRKLISTTETVEDNNGLHLMCKYSSKTSLASRLNRQNNL